MIESGGGERGLREKGYGVAPGPPSVVPCRSHPFLSTTGAPSLVPVIAPKSPKSRTRPPPGLSLTHSSLPLAHPSSLVLSVAPNPALPIPQPPPPARPGAQQAVEGSSGAQLREEFRPPLLLLPPAGQARIHSQGALLQSSCSPSPAHIWPPYVRYIG